LLADLLDDAVGILNGEREVARMLVQGELPDVGSQNRRGHNGERHPSQENFHQGKSFTSHQLKAESNNIAFGLARNLTPFVSKGLTPWCVYLL
jgi:hypothetical protein